MIFKFYISVALAVIVLQLFMIQSAGRKNTENTVFSQAEISVLNQAAGKYSPTSQSTTQKATMPLPPVPSSDRPIDLQNLLRN